MISAIKKILYGNCKIDSLKKDERCNEAMKNICLCDEELEKLFGDDNELLEKYKKAGLAHFELCDAQSEMFFKRGFALGVLLGLEIAEIEN